MSDEIQTPDDTASADSLSRDPSFFEALLANTSDVVTVLDAKGTITYHSPAIQNMLGVAPGDSIGLHAADIVHRDDQEQVAKGIQSSIENPGSHAINTFRLPHANGTWRWIEADVRNLLSDPSINGVLVVCKDITDRRRLEEYLSIAEQTSAISTFRWEVETQMATVSEATASMLGLSSLHTTIGSEDFSAFLHPDDKKAAFEAAAGAMNDRAPFTLHMRLKHDGGSYRSFILHAFPELGEGGKVVAIFGVIDDVTEELNTKLALQETEAQYRLIAEHSDDMLARHTPDGHITFLSPAAKKVLGVDPDALIGQDMVQFIHHDDRQDAREAMENLSASSDSARLTFRLQHLDGHFIWFESTLHAVFDEFTGEVVEVIAVTRDITERKGHEQKLLKARERAEAANRAKSSFLANMSHELRTPLNAIIGFSEILKREMYGPLGDPNYSDYAGLIHDSGSHLLDLINDILDMSKIEAGKVDINIEELDLADIARSSIRFVEPKSTGKNQNVLLDLEPGVEDVPVEGDMRATKQILLNLLSNAVKFTGDDGTIRVTIRSLADAVEIAVEDSGMGIAPDDIARIMQPFEQVVGESSIAEEGSGLGLALTKSFCDLQNGGFSLESTVGTGTRVAVTLPKVNTHAAAVSA